MDQISFVNVEKGSRFGFHLAGGSLVEIGDTPVSVSDPAAVAYLDSVRFVKRAGKAKADPGGGEGE